MGEFIYSLNYCPSDVTFSITHIPLFKQYPSSTITVLLSFNYTVTRSKHKQNITHSINHKLKGSETESNGVPEKLKFLKSKLQGIRYGNYLKFANLETQSLNEKKSIFDVICSENTCS